MNAQAAEEDKRASRQVAAQRRAARQRKSRLESAVREGGRKPGDVHHVYLNLFLNIAGPGFWDGRKVTLWAEEGLFAVNFSSVPPRSIPKLQPKP
jgi:hypothetical protein